MNNTLLNYTYQNVITQISGFKLFYVVRNFSTFYYFVMYVSLPSILSVNQTSLEAEKSC